jgi:hypothetical protein
MQGGDPMDRDGSIARERFINAQQKGRWNVIGLQVSQRRFPAALVRHSTCWGARGRN